MSSDLTDSLVARVRESFEPTGVLSRAADHFRQRDGQTDMALAVARTIEDGGVLMRGSRDFADLAAYRCFIDELSGRHNA